MPPPALDVKRTVVLLHNFIALGRTIEKAKDHIPGINIYATTTIVIKCSTALTVPSKIIAGGGDERSVMTGGGIRRRRRRGVSLRRQYLAIE